MLWQFALTLLDCFGFSVSVGLSFGIGFSVDIGLLVGTALTASDIGLTLENCLEGTFGLTELVSTLSGSMFDISSSSFSSAANVSSSIPQYLLIDSLEHTKTCVVGWLKSVAWVSPG